MATNRTNQKIRFENGRSLGYADYDVVYCFHGFPGSQLDKTYPLSDDVEAHRCAEKGHVSDNNSIYFNRRE